MAEEEKVVNEAITVEMEQTEKKSSSKKQGFFKVAGKLLFDVGKKVAKMTKEEADKIKSSIDFKKEFIKETYEFEIEGTNGSFRGFKNPDNDVIYFRVEDKNVRKYVKSNSILIRTSDNLKLSVLSVETKKVENGTLVVNGAEIPISLFTIQTKLYEKERITSVTNKITQTMTISGSTIQGNIQQINDLTNKLNDFEHQLCTYNPGLLSKKSHVEAVKIYGDVKNSIINGQKENSIVQKFLALLGKLGGPLLAVFSAIIK